jgi:hypothetical protein
MDGTGDYVFFHMWNLDLKKKRHVEGGLFGTRKGPRGRGEGRLER